MGFRESLGHELAQRGVHLHTETHTDENHTHGRVRAA